MCSRFSISGNRLSRVPATDWKFLEPWQTKFKCQSFSRPPVPHGARSARKRGKTVQDSNVRRTQRINTNGRSHTKRRLEPTPLTFRVVIESRFSILVWGAAGLRERGGKGEKERETDRQNLSSNSAKTLFSKDCSLGSV